jgi:PAS domain S-box-containing protein
MTEILSNSAPPVRVMVVEDERVIAHDLKDCLEALGYCVPGMATSGEEAILKARELRPDVILMDIRLEGKLDGVQAADQIWDELQIPAIYATGYSDQATVDRATASELFGYILKPIKERDLYIAIKAALQRHGQQSRLLASQQWANTILQAIGDGIIVTDAQGRVKFLNSVAESLIGWGLSEAIDQPISQVFRRVDEQTGTAINNPVIEVLLAGKTVSLVNPVLLVTPTRNKVSITESAAPLKDQAGKVIGAVVIFRNVSEQDWVKERAVALQKAQILEQQLAEIQRLNQIKDDFLSTVSHELRSPLANIKMSIHMLEMSWERRSLASSESEVNSHSERVARYLKILRNECDQELRLVNELLELQRLESGTVNIEWAAIALEEWIPQVMEVYQERAEQRQIQTQVSLPEGLPPLVSDLAILTSAFSELLNNACKYTPDRETIIVSAQVIPATATLRLLVGNSGIEIPADKLPHIFDRFYRINRFTGKAAQNSDRFDQTGTGLGLSLVQKQIICLGGTIEAQSDADEVRFVIELPLHPPHAIS